VFVPKGVPDDTRKQISSAIRAAVASDDFQNALKNLQVPVDFREGEDFRKFIAADSKMLENAIRQIGKVDGK
ncbi:MAG: hypothetical protein AB7V13_22015, partial [Pseudorhodoplanes sp.]